MDDDYCQFIVGITLQVLDYYPDLGEFYWNKNSVYQEGSKAGRVAITSGKEVIKLPGGIRVQTNKLVWAIEKGEFHKGQFAHINGDPLDNRISNLEKSRKYYAAQKKKKEREARGSHALKSKRACKRLLTNLVRNYGHTKQANTERELGYTYAEFRQHMEAQFEDWMTWDNYGEWEVDHIKPISAYILEGVHDPAVINSLDNLQPMSAWDNRSKGSVYNGRRHIVYGERFTDDGSVKNVS